MKTLIIKPQNVGIAMALSLCFADQALASASYDSSVSVNYAITVLDSNNPTLGDNTGLAILGTFLQPSDEQSFYATVTGDGQYQTASPSPTSSSVASHFNDSFSASGSAGLGTVDSLHTGLFGLALSNSGPYSYSLAIHFDYSLQAIAHGEFANSAILFDYWDEAGAISGSDYASVASFSGFLNDQQSASGAAIWLFTQAPGASQQLYAQAGITSQLQSADTSPVPVPAAAWLFGSALAGLGLLGKRKRI